MSHCLFATTHWNSSDEVAALNCVDTKTIRALYAALDAMPHFRGCSGDGGRTRLQPAQFRAARAAFSAFVAPAAESRLHGYAIDFLDSCIARNCPLWVHFK